MTHSQEKANTVFAVKGQSCFSLQLVFLLLFAVLVLSGSPGYCTGSGTDKVGSGWYVRLIVAAEDGRIDRGNVLGYLEDAGAGKDRHDLPEMAPPPPPMGDRFLSIVFPHPEWGGDMPDYASDYRPVPADSGQGDVWPFEVRTHTPGIKVMLSWEGPAAVLGRSRLKEGKNGKILVENCAAVASHEFMLTGKVSKLVWEYLGQPAAAADSKQKN
jgi:hypothetical protein